MKSMILFLLVLGVCIIVATALPYGYEQWFEIYDHVQQFPEVERQRDDHDVNVNSASDDQEKFDKLIARIKNLLAQHVQDNQAGYGGYGKYGKYGK